MDLTPLNAAIEAAYQTALINPQLVMPQTIAENVTLQTDTYTAATGPGFKVICIVTISSVNFRVSRVRNHGPDTASEREWPAEGIEAAAQAHVAKCLTQGAGYVTAKGFDADKKVILLNKLLSVKEADALAAKPKLVALYTWMEIVQGMAIAGQTMFPQPPHTFEEVLSE
jgi:hypothetical protein